MRSAALLALALGLCARPSRAAPELAGGGADAGSAALTSTLSSPAPAWASPLQAGFGAMTASTQDSLLSRMSLILWTKNIEPAALAAMPADRRQAVVDETLARVARDVYREAEAAARGGQDDPRRALDDIARFRGLYDVLERKAELDWKERGALTRKLDEIALAARKKIEAAKLERAAEVAAAADAGARTLERAFEPGFETEALAGDAPETARMRGLLEELHSERSAHAYRYGLLPKIRKAAVASRDPRLQAVALKAVMDDAFLRPDERPVDPFTLAGAADRALLSARDIAVASGDPRVRALAVALLDRHRKVYADKFLDRAIDRVTDYGRQVASLPLTKVDEPKALFARRPTPKIGLLAQLAYGERDHPVMLRVLLACAAALLSAAVYLGMPPLMLPFAAYPLLYATVKSLWRHQGLVGLAMLPGLLYTLMIPVQHGFSALTLAATAAAVVGTLVAARLSFKKDAGFLPAWVGLGLALAARGLLLALGL